MSTALYRLRDYQAIRKRIVRAHEQAVEFQAAYRDTERARQALQAEINELYRLLGKPAFCEVKDDPDEAA